MTTPISRRAFLGILAASGIAAAGCYTPSPGQGNGQRAVILGAGLAGLSAAYNLMRSGFEVVVLEAQDRPGGRVQTVREPFLDSGYAEMGAIRIPDVHKYTNKYIEEFGLKQKLFGYNEPESKLWYLDGQRFTTPKIDQGWPLEGMSNDERRDPSAKLATYLGPALAAVGDVHSENWPNVGDETLALDDFTLAQFAQKNGATDAWIDFLAAAEGNLGDVNTLAFAGVEAALHGFTRTYGLRGGNDQLPQAFATAMGNRVSYRAIVQRIDSQPDKVVVGYHDSNGTQQQITADFAVCTIPFPVLKKLSITGLAEQKMQAIQQYQLAAAARVYFQTRSAFWRNDPLGALGGLKMIGTDTLVERIWNTSVGQPGPQGMLHAYLIGDNAETLASVPHQERNTRIRAEISRFLPGLSSQVVASHVKVWREDPFAGGAFAFAQPGQLHWIFPAARRPDNRLHFAGEHTSVSLGWMDGALESGERVATEITTRAAA
ncbi:MAG: FAD-dependent oxidoreductase [Actinomycetota bacterium]|nr:FAD-dependent oxidoreductase [Actinomycetota bacterium]